MPARAATCLVVTEALPRSLNNSRAAFRTRSRVRRAPSVVGIRDVVRAYALTTVKARSRLVRRVTGPAQPTVVVLSSRDGKNLGQVPDEKRLARRIDRDAILLRLDLIPI